MNTAVKAAIIYFALISVISVAVTVYDKAVSKIEGHRRVPEKTLITLSVLGGSAAMLATMLLIRHKTKHAKFMVGIPIIILFQVIVIYYLFVYQNLGGLS